MVSFGDFVTLASKSHDLLKATAKPVFERVEYGGICPEAVALPICANDVVCNDAISESEAIMLLKESADDAWCHELRLRMWVRNASSRVVSIIGIAPNKRFLIASSTQQSCFRLKAQSLVM